MSSEFELLGESPNIPSKSREFVLGRYLEGKIINTEMPNPILSLCKINDNSLILRSSSGLSKFDLANNTLQEIILEGKMH